MLFVMRLAAPGPAAFRGLAACRRGADLHAGLTLCAPVFWAALTVFVSPISGAAGFALHAFLCLPKKRVARAALLLAYPLCALWFAGNFRALGSGFLFHVPPRRAGNFRYYVGTVGNFPAPGYSRVTFPFRTDRGCFLASLPADAPWPRWGATGLLLAREQPPAAPDNPGQSDARRSLRSQGEISFLSGETWKEIRPPPRWMRVLAGLRTRLERSLQQNVPAPERPLLEGTLLNERQRIPEETRQAFLRSGMQHILAISGEHIALLAAFLLFGALWLRLPRKTAFTLAAAAVAVYIPVVGAPPSVVRAGWMLALLLPALWRERPASALNALALCVTGELLLHPTLILNLGFQLSYAATLSLVLCAGGARDLAARCLRPRLLRGALGVVLLSVMVNLYTYPLLAASVHAFAPWSVLGNLLVTPLAAAMLLAGLCTWVFTPFPPLAHAAGACAALASALLDGGVHALARLPGALRSAADPPAVWLWIFAAAIFAITAAWRARAGRLALLGLAVLAVAEFFRPAVTRRLAGEPVRSTFLDVGQGDGAVVELPGAVYVIDAGPSQRTAQRTLLSYLRSRGIQRLDGLVLTHPDCDHFGGAFALVGSFPITTILSPKTSPDAQPSWRSLQAQARRRGVPWRPVAAGDWLYRRGAVSLSVLGPDSSLDSASDNNRSVVCLLATPKRRALFTGDIEGPGQKALASTWPLWRHAWLKAPHHGSDRTTLPCFLRAEAPPQAVISAGHRPGFPGRQTLALLRSLGAEVQVTAHAGAVRWDFAPGENTP